MAFFRRNRTAFVAPTGLVTVRRKLELSVPFVYDPAGAPAVQVSDMFRKSNINLTKSFDASTTALEDVQLKGMRCELVVLVDGSGSMGDEYNDLIVEAMLNHTLGFGMNVSPSKKITVIVYGSKVNKPFVVDTSNYQQANSLLKPDFSCTNMADAMQAAFQLAKANKFLTLIVNITDGGPYLPGRPNIEVETQNVYMDTSGWPIIVKNLAVRPVGFLSKVDDLPSYVEIVKDENDKPVLNNDNSLVLEINPQGIRLIDNVDSQAFDPRQTDANGFARYMAVEIGTCLEVMGRIGILTGVPGVELDQALVSQI